MDKAEIFILVDVWGVVGIRAVRMGDDGFGAESLMEMDSFGGAFIHVALQEYDISYGIPMDPIFCGGD